MSAVPIVLFLLPIPKKQPQPVILCEAADGGWPLEQSGTKQVSRQNSNIKPSVLGTGDCGGDDLVACSRLLYLFRLKLGRKTCSP